MRTRTGRQWRDEGPYDAAHYGTVATGRRGYSRDLGPSDTEIAEIERELDPTAPCDPGQHRLRLVDGARSCDRCPYRGK
jgi:hypothetical protein